MDHTDPMPDDVFDRLTILERAQFLSDSAQRRHALALDRQQRDLDRHAAMHQEHLTRMAHLETLLDRQQALQQTLVAQMARLEALHEDNRTRLTQNEAMLRELIDLHRRRNGHEEDAHG